MELTTCIVFFRAAPGREPLVPDGHRVMGRGLRPRWEVRLLYSRLQVVQVVEESYREDGEDIRTTASCFTCRAT